MSIVIGKRYFGPYNAPRIVTAVEGDTVSWFTPATLAADSGPIADFQAWTLESDRRNYVHSNGERRIKLEATDPVVEDGAEIRPAGVIWVHVDAPYDRQWSSLDDWASWRADAT